MALIGRVFVIQDVITDLHAEAEPIPYHLHRHDWLGHKVRWNIDWHVNRRVL